MSGKITAFGIYFENLRKREKETLEESAKKLGVSIAYLHSIIHGQRDIPLDFDNKIESAYSLSDQESLLLEKAIDETPRLKKITREEIRWCLVNMINNIAESKEEKEKLTKTMEKIFASLDSKKSKN